MQEELADTTRIGFEEFREKVLGDYSVACLSRQCSVLGRREVLNGRAKFGIFGDGKEVAQVAMARQFRAGDWRSGYYRDQTFMLATGMSTPVEFFAQLYGDTDQEANPGNSGRVMNNHYSTPNRNPDGSVPDLAERMNSTADLSPTAAQMPRLVGLGYASKLFRNHPEWNGYTHLSRNGNEVAFGMIGDASTAEGHFFETMNAAGVLQIPVAIAVWDDGYGISVPRVYQLTKENISDLMKGFEDNEGNRGIRIYKSRGWDYPHLCKTFEEGIQLCREMHIPVLFHIDEMTQPLGHSTSGSHERYKPEERLNWEREHDPVRKMKEWIIASGISTETELEDIETEAEKQAVRAKNRAWENFTGPILRERESLMQVLEGKSCRCRNDRFDKIGVLTGNLKKVANPLRKDLFSTAKKILRHICLDCPERESLQSKLTAWMDDNYDKAWSLYSTCLYNERPTSALRVDPVPPAYTDEYREVTGREILRENFDLLFTRHPMLVTFGEDTGMIGGVNQCLEGLQGKYGEHRISDTGIREATIIGQGIGLALRGFRPIAEIQYFDYLLYGLQTLSDDLSTLHYRTGGNQVAPLIVRTRGHRLEGMWHSGSPLSMVINSIRGMYVCVPRDMTRAAGFYNTLLDGDDPAIVIEPLNGYRLRERMPANLAEMRIPPGMAEVLMEGDDVTLVTYGSCTRIAMEAAGQLREFDIATEVIDVQTLLPFDLDQKIVESVKKTRKVVFLDEDVPGGASAYMLQKFLEDQDGFRYLDSEPVTVTQKEHRPAYGTDGDYFSNPNVEDVFEAVYEVMHEYRPAKYPGIY